MNFINYIEVFEEFQQSTI